MDIAGDTFRVMTPQTPQRTALKENSSADSGSVMDAEELYIENASGSVVYLFDIHYYSRNLYNNYALAMDVKSGAPSG